MERKTLTQLIEEYKSDPLTEFRKINRFITKTDLASDYSCFDGISEGYLLCEQMSSIFPDLQECLCSWAASLYDVEDSVCFSSLAAEKKEQILCDFLVYCEVLLTSLVFCVTTLLDFFRYKYGFTEAALQQPIRIIKASLKSVGYTISVEPETRLVEARKIDPVAEEVAEGSNPDIKQAILSYLSSKPNDLQGKRTRLWALIDAMAPTFSKYRNEKLVEKAREYSQLIRHPEKRKEKKFQWFFEDEKANLDTLFRLLLSAQQYVVGSEIKDEFDKKTHSPSTPE